MELATGANEAEFQMKGANLAEAASLIGSLALIEFLKQWTPWDDRPVRRSAQLVLLVVFSLLIFSSTAVWQATAVTFLAALAIVGQVFLMHHVAPASLRGEDWWREHTWLGILLVLPLVLAGASIMALLDR